MGETVSVVLHIEPEQKEALARWAEAEQRSLSAQARILLGDAIPEEYFEAGE